MYKIVVILSLVVLVEYAVQDVAWANKHVVAQEEHSLILTEREEFIGPVRRNDGLSQRTEQPAWNRLNLTHTDPPHLFGMGPHHAGTYRNSQPADGTALMFSWPFGSSPTFQKSTDAALRETNLNQENGMTDPYLR